jgi:hypothetical protein
MKTKIANKKSICNKNSVETITPQPVEIQIPAKVIADVVDCSVVYVKKIRRGARPNDSELAQKIEVTDKLMTDGMDKLLKEVRELMTPKTSI